MCETTRTVAALFSPQPECLNLEAFAAPQFHSARLNFKEVQLPGKIFQPSRRYEMYERRERLDAGKWGWGHGSGRTMRKLKDGTQYSARVQHGAYFLKRRSYINVLQNEPCEHEVDRLKRQLVGLDIPREEFEARKRVFETPASFLDIFRVNINPHDSRYCTSRKMFEAVSPGASENGDRVGGMPFQHVPEHIPKEFGLSDLGEIHMGFIVGQRDLQPRVFHEIGRCM